MDSAMFVCLKCEKTFTLKRNYQQHIKRSHPSDYVSEKRSSEPLYKCLEGNGCEAKFHKSNLFIDHLERIHNVPIDRCEWEFESYQEFQIWLEDIQKCEKVRYFRTRGKKNCKNLYETMYLYCSRTGQPRLLPENARKRCMKSQGTRKIGSGCTSHIILKRFFATDQYKINYVSTHYGHLKESQHLFPSRGIRYEEPMDEEAQKILARIHDRIRRSTPTHNIDKIRRQFRLTMNDGHRHVDDATSVALWVQECQSSTSNPVLFFKKQGQVLSEYNFEESDFCLILMNQTQKEMFGKHGMNVVCVDGHKINPQALELTAVSILDDLGEGFPVAFMFSNRKDIYVYEVFFRHIKQATMAVSTDIFMSDITDAYYNAWFFVMGGANVHLYCSWHVDRAWREVIETIPDRPKRAWLNKTLKYLQTIVDVGLFDINLQKFLAAMSADTSPFYDYFMQDFFNNQQQWAYCFRPSTSMNLESMHNVMKGIYLDGKIIKRLDKLLHVLQKFTRDKSIDHLIISKTTDNMRQVQLPHQAACDKTYDILEIDEDSFIVTDVENSIDSNVKRVLREATCCSLKCDLCNICVHTFSCSCSEYTLNLAICEHIHSLHLPCTPVIKECLQEEPTTDNLMDMQEWKSSMKAQWQEINACLESTDTISEEEIIYLDTLKNMADLMKSRKEQSVVSAEDIKDVDFLTEVSEPVLLPENFEHDYAYMLVE